MDSPKEQSYIDAIKLLPKSAEKRVISFGLYGNNPKYTTGAVRNAELRDTYFPGWVLRFYADASVPGEILARLKELGCELVEMDKYKGEAAGMFWRFLVADDESVDRWIVRDSDSRLNARDRFAVEEWITSGKVRESKCLKCLFAHHVGVETQKSNYRPTLPARVPPSAFA